MSEPPDRSQATEARRWLAEAQGDLAYARYQVDAQGDLASARYQVDAEELPARIACFQPTLPSKRHSRPSWSMPEPWEQRLQSGRLEPRPARSDDHLHPQPTVIEVPAELAVDASRPAPCGPGRDEGVENVVRMGAGEPLPGVVVDVGERRPERREPL